MSINVMVTVILSSLLTTGGVLGEGSKPPDLLESISLSEKKGLAPQVYIEPVNPRHTALVIVDIQDDRKRPIRSEPKQRLLDGCAKLLRAARKYEIVVVYVANGCWTFD